jgi:glucose-6-phosphate 1-dehydrogenase
VAIKAEIDTWRWAGVPFYLRTGKRLQEQSSEIVITFEDVPHSIFGGGSAASPNRLRICLQPTDSITLSILAKKPGDGLKLQPVDLSLDLAASFKTQQLDAYERLLMDVVKGNLTLFMRRDEVDAAWRWIDPIREGWLQQDVQPKGYTAGSWGPAAASALQGAMDWAPLCAPPLPAAACAALGTTAQLAPAAQPRSSAQWAATALQAVARQLPAPAPPPYPDPLTVTVTVTAS